MSSNRKHRKNLGKATITHLRGGKVRRGVIQCQLTGPHGHTVPRQDVLWDGVWFGALCAFVDIHCSISTCFSLIFKKINDYYL